MEPCHARPGCGASNDLQGPVLVRLSMHLDPHHVPLAPRGGRAVLYQPTLWVPVPCMEYEGRSTEGEPCWKSELIVIFFLRLQATQCMSNRTRAAKVLALP